jgi:tetratricopeptide (TPR) repeat protein
MSSLMYQTTGYSPPPPPPPNPIPMVDTAEVMHEVRAQQPSPPRSKKSSAFTGKEILGTARRVSGYEQAQLYFLEGDWHGAIKTLEQFIKKMRSSDHHMTEEMFAEMLADSFFLLGFCYQTVGDYPNAIRTLGEAAKRKPDHFMTQYQLGSAYFWDYLATGDKGKLREAIEPYKKVIELDQERVDIAAVTLGFIYSVLRDWDNAEKYYLKGIELSKNSASAQQQLASLYMQMGDDLQEKKEHYYLKAAQALEKKLKPSPRDSDAYNFLGYVYQSIGKSELAAKAYERAVKIDAHNLLALANLTAVYLDAERYEEAKELHQRILRIKPQVVKKYLIGKIQRPPEDVIRFRSDAYLGYGVACMELYRVQASADGGEGRANPKLLQEAEKALKKAIEVDPNSASAFYDLAVLYYRQNRQDEAQAAVRRALAIDPNSERLREHVQKLLQEQLQQRLLARGAIKEVRKPITDYGPYRNRTMLAVSGKPLSQVIVEERR